MRIVADSNAYDALIGSPTVYGLVLRLAEAGAIHFLMTSVQEGELLAVPDAQKREAIAAIPRTLVPTYGMVAGRWRTEHDQPGQLGKIEAIRDYPSKHPQAALIAATAHFVSAVLVTNDRRLRDLARQAGVEVWSPERLVAFLQGVDGGRGP